MDRDSDLILIAPDDRQNFHEALTASTSLCVAIWRNILSTETVSYLISEQLEQNLKQLLGANNGKVSKEEKSGLLAYSLIH